MRELTTIEPGVVPAHEWSFIDLRSDERERWLADPIPPLALISEVVAEANAQAARGAIKIVPDTHRETSRRRVVVTFEFAPRVFDQLFNGRSGYRAQYYLSAQVGRAYNRRLVDALTPAISTAFDCLEEKPMAWIEIAHSLAAPESKIWPAADWMVFSRYCGRARIRVSRWEQYWDVSKPAREASGLFANLPSPALVTAKGTFLPRGETPPSYKDRDSELHERGFT